MAGFKSKSNSSIIFRMNAHFLGERFCIFLIINIFLCIFFVFCGFLFAERQISDVVSTAQVAIEQEMALEEARLLNAVGYNVILTDSVPEPLPTADFLKKLLPDNTAEGSRAFSFDKSQPAFKDRVGSVSYTVSVPIGEIYEGASYLSVSVRVGPVIQYFLLGGFLLLIWQGFSLLSAIFRNTRQISRILKPLQELTETTRSLSSGGQLSPVQLQRLAGALDSINATHLDKRLSVNRLNDELRPLAAAINEMLGRIDESYRFQMRFVSDASHELRTPIAVIQGYASLLERWGTEDPDTLRESITAIKSEADSMKELVEQLLFLARGDNDTMHLEWETLDLSALAAAALKDTELIDRTHTFKAGLPATGREASNSEDSESAAAAQNPEVETIAAEAVPALIYGDRGLIKQLLRILLDNSVKYTPAGGCITISVSVEQNRVLLVIQDEGIGIPTEALPHIFDRFYRADESRTRETGGTGLGLSIAKWIVERHEGYFEVTSRKGIGTRMSVYFPLYSS